MDHLQLFSTELFVFEPPGTAALCEALTRQILEDRDATPGLRRSNVGGWHSAPNLSQRPEPCFGALMQLMVDHLGQALQAMAARERGALPRLRYGVHAWAMVMEEGDYTTPHDHAAAHWSAVFYADAGDADLARWPQSGRLAFLDPRRATPAIPGLGIGGSDFSLAPRTGLLVLFPGWLQHYVHPYRGSRPRVCVSGNLQVEVTPSSRPA
ncbi:MAG: hypothetical protein H6739_28285 [Alphaproteobacteria bacterium]|nr:hypothetical protein [Alphaproteobacteria bacterium]